MVAHDVHWDGGMERAFAELIERRHDEVEFHVLSSTLAPALRPLVTWHRVPAPAKPFPLKFALFSILAWWRARSIDRDLVHTCGGIVPMRADVVSVHFSHRGRRATGDGFMPGEGTWPRRMNTALARVMALAAERWCFRPGRARTLACVSTGLASEMATLYPRLTLRMTPNGVDVDRFQPDPDARDALRRSEGVPDDTVVALFVGGDWARKGVLLAIQAIAQASASCGRRIELWVVGPGDIPEYSRLSRELSVEGSVRFFGPRIDTERLYAAADVFVLPSQYETFSLVAHEAAASGLPIVATAVHGIDELLAAGAGLEVRRDPSDIARALASLAADPALREIMGSAGRAHASSLTWSHSARSVTALYSALLPPIDDDRTG